MIQPYKKSEGTQTVSFPLKDTLNKVSQFKRKLHYLLNTLIICDTLSWLPLIPCFLNPVYQVFLSISQVAFILGTQKMGH